MKELTLVFLRRDNQLLLAMKKRGFGEGRWNGVGGKLEPGEGVEAALIREAQEEIHVTPLTYHQVADLSFNEFFKGEPAQMHVHVFMCTSWEGEPRETDEMKPQWFDIEDLPYESMWSDDAYWLPQVLSGKKLVAQFDLDVDDRITNHTIKEVGKF